MIEASFEGMKERSAAVSGAYQYDTGQRLRMHGLPSPKELAGRDDFLSGDTVTVQAQYAYAGDSQTEMRLALYDEETDTWTAAVPDAYLAQNADVHVYVYVGYGQTEESMRAKTCYEAVFRPTGRPAPGTEVTSDQKNAWDALMQEVNLAIADVNTAASSAYAQATVAKEAADWAESSAQMTDECVAKLEAMTAAVQTLPAGSEATVVLADKETHKEFTFGIPKGDPGIIRINDTVVTENGEITLTAKDVGAMPDTHQTVFEFEARMTEPIMWYVDGNTQTCEISVPGILASDRPVIDIDFTGFDPLTQDVVDQMEENWAKVVRVDTYDGRIGLVCLDDTPSVLLPLRVLCVR